jgi:hypothetical protein
VLEVRHSTYVSGSAQREADAAAGSGSGELPSADTASVVEAKKVWVQEHAALVVRLFWFDHDGVRFGERVLSHTCDLP